jgi:hypothetical protein
MMDNHLQSWIQSKSPFKKIRRYQIDSNRSFAILLVGGFNPSEKYESQWEG